ncbi:MAG: YciI family protein [Gemmatimonadaceae bacterium]|nr:YciI family protein [Gemmatimonadaceae bacterium]
MLILHDDLAALQAISPAEMQRVIERYQAWSETMAAKGHMRGGEKLRDASGRHLTKPGGTLVVRDAPYAEAKEVVGGYFLIEAQDYDEAVALSSDCPHLALGGRIELREIEPLG